MLSAQAWRVKSIWSSVNPWISASFAECLFVRLRTARGFLMRVRLLGLR